MNNCGINELMDNKILTISQHYDTYCSVECIKYIHEFWVLPVEKLNAFNRTEGNKHIYISNIYHSLLVWAGTYGSMEEKDSLGRSVN